MQNTLYKLYYKKSKNLKTTRLYKSQNVIHKKIECVWWKIQKTKASHHHIQIQTIIYKFKSNKELLVANYKCDQLYI